MSENEKENSSHEVNSLADSIYWIDSGRQASYASVSNVKRWITDHNLYNRELRYISTQFYNMNGVYTNVIDYMIALPVLNKIVYKKHNKVSKDKKDKFKRALEMIKETILIRDILRKIAIEGIYFGYFDSNSSNDDIYKGAFSDYDIDNTFEINATPDFNCSVLNLPVDYCQIIGTKNSNYVMAFNLSYFDQFRSNGLSQRLQKYPKEIRDGYKKYMKERSKPWLPLDSTKTIVVKIRSDASEKWGRPLGLAAFVDILFDQYYVDVKRDTLQEFNSGLIYQTYPEGEKKGTSSLTAPQQTNQHAHIRNAIFSQRSKNGSTFFSVAAGTKLEKIKVDLDILSKISEEDLIQRISTDLGFAGSVLNGINGDYSSQQTNLEMVSAEIYSWVDLIVSELNKVIGNNILNDEHSVGLYFQPITHLNMKDKTAVMKDLYTQGRGSLIAWIAATGFNTDAYLSLMDEELEENFDEKYPVHQSSFTLTGEEKKPAEDKPTNKNTIKNKTKNTNSKPSPSSN